MATLATKTANDLAEARTGLAGNRTDLAIERTVMAANRTLMGWIRTALSLVSFGFTIYKILEAATKDASVAFMKVEGGPRRLGLTLIALGTVSVILGSIEYYGTVKRLNQRTEDHYNPLNFSFIVGLMVGLLSLLLFLTIMTHTEIF